MLQRLASRRLSGLFRIFAIVACATLCRGFSINSFKEKTPPSGENISVQSFGRRSLLIAPSLLWIGQQQLPARASDDKPNDGCVTECFYACETKTNKKLWPKSRDTCRAKCPRKECLPPPPERKREPRQLQAKDIEGLYPRWQDTF
jgi:hypothetical protein